MAAIAGFAMAVAGLLGAAERQVRFRADGRRVHVDDSGVRDRAWPRKAWFTLRV